MRPAWPGPARGSPSAYGSTPLKTPMRNLLFLGCLLPLLACQATLPAGRTVGESIEPKNIVALSVVHAAPSDYFEQTLLVDAEAVAVCQSMGCWMKIKDGDADAMVRWEEGCGGKYAFPSDIVGRRIVIQGSFYPKLLSEEDAEHLQSEAAPGVTIEREGYEFNASAILIPSEQ